MRFERLKAITPDFERITDHTILIFGLGGVGSFAAEAIARSGFQRILLVDYDAVDPTNINRQIIALEDTVGKIKTELMKERILNINPQCHVTVFTEKVTNANIESFFVNKVDYVLECIDDLHAKIEIAKYTEMRNIHLIASMGFANKFDPTKIQISPLNKTTVCPLARAYRHQIKAANLSVKREVVYSTEIPSKPEGNIKLGSTAFVPSVAGLFLAAHVFNFYRQEVL